MEYVVDEVKPVIEFESRLAESFFFFYHNDAELLQAWLLARGFNADAKFIYLDPVLVISQPGQSNKVIKKGQRIEYWPGRTWSGERWIETGPPKFLMITTSMVESL